MKLIYVLFILTLFIRCNTESLNEIDLQNELIEEFGEFEEEVPKGEEELYKAYNKTLEHWNVPYQEIYVPTSYGKAHVIVTGNKNAAPLVLLHGMNASATMWYPNIKALTGAHRVYAIDLLIEPGKSQRNKEIFSMDAVVDWYFEIFDELELDKFSLVGASEGGWLSTSIAIKESSRVNKLVLLSPLQTFMWIPPSGSMSVNILFSLFPKKEELENVLQTMAVKIDQIEQDFLDQFYVSTQHARFGLKKFQIVPFSKDELSTLKMPVLVMIGDQDIINKEKSLERAEDRLANVQTEMIADAGHFLSMDQADLVNSMMVKFLNKK
jgi:pimeloyl-ACP methyl ester carboxylesterase